MSNKKTIKIFIGSSIVEFENERVSLVNFLYKLRNQLKDVEIDHFVCEEADTYMSSTRKQDEFNKEMDDSDICLFLFHKKAGAYTLEELDYAFKLYNESEEGKKRPRIYIFFKNPNPSESIDSSIEELKDRLDRQYQHFFCNFDDLDTVKLRMLLILKFQELNMLQIDVKDGQLHMNGRPVEEININNVMEFVNNGDLRALEDEYRRVEDKYLDMKPKYTEGGCPDEFCKEFAETENI